jgi:hypothetical protein
MAKVTNALDTYTAVGQREDLSDVIYNISPEETPFVSAIGKRSVSNTKFEWQVEALPAVATTAQIEGATISTAAPTNTTRSSNQCQILTRSAAVTGTQAAMNRAGVSDAMAHQIALISRALKRDVETMLLLNQAVNTGNASTGRTAAGLPAYVATNVTVGHSGSPTNPTDTAGGSDPRNDGTARALTEALLKVELKNCFNNSGDQPNMIMVDSTSKQVISGFAGRASATSVVALPGKADEVNANVSVYIGDFGTYTVHTNRFQRSKDCWLINPEYAKVAQLRPFEVSELGTTGDATSRFITWEGGLQVDNEAAHGLVADVGG